MFVINIDVNTIRNEIKNTTTTHLVYFDYFVKRIPIKTLVNLLNNYSIILTQIFQ